MKDKIFYHIYPIGLCGCPNINEGDKTKGNRILKLLDWVEHLQNMGVNAVYLGPIWESKSHGYDTTDYYKLDSRLGTNDDLKMKIGKEKNDNELIRNKNRSKFKENTETYV